MAGISAARKLDMAGIHDFLVLEARGEIGGRLQTIDVGGYTLEAGNWWVQGGKGNPIFDKRYVSLHDYKFIIFISLHLYIV